MENKNVGWLIIGISVLVIIMIFLFNNALKDFVESSCTMAHGSVEFCPMNQTINQQTYLSLAIAGVIVIIGLVLIFSKQKEKVIVKRIKERKAERKVDLSGFRPEEQLVFRIINEEGAVFQADLIEKTGFGKAKMSRIIDRLEGRGLVERKRRGMTNVVVLKED